jgi:pimeloyl-ACP methyl ester carboxylesterase
MVRNLKGEVVVFPKPVTIELPDITLATYIAGDGEPVVFLHGFPEIAYSWRHQVAALSDAGFMAVAPDLRGYGGSSRPASVDEYTIQHLTGDVLGLLDALGLPTARFVAHDWGAIVLWQFALMHPERVDSMAVLNIPFYPRPPIDPIEIFRHRHGNDHYIVNFQDSDEADRRFASDPDRLFRRLLRKNQLPREQFDALPAEMQTISLLRSFERDEPGGEALLCEDELAVFVESFRHSGFSGGINWYRNMTHNWKTTEGIEQRVRVPTLFIGAHDDVVIPLADIEAMRDYVDDLRIDMLAPCGHWSQQERPEDVNRLLLDFFRA